MKPILNFIQILTTVALLAVAQASYAQRIVAEVDRKKISANEAIKLNVMTDQNIGRDAIDFSVLEGDFEILSFRPSSRTQIINGKSSAQTTWQLELFPKRTGKLFIPSFAINTIKTNPIAITVTAASNGTAQTAPLIAIVKFNKEEAFVNEQIFFTLEITANAEVNHIQGGPSLDESTAEITLVEKNDYKKRIGGKPFEIIERVYAIFASKPGVIEVPAGTYRGWLKVEPTRANNYQRAQPVVARTRPLKITVQDPAADKSASANSPWFPARGVAISSAWTGDKTSMRVGEPITRTIRVEAEGQRAAAIPPIVYQSDGFKQYAEQPVLKDDKREGNVIGVRTDAIAIVPSRAGELKLPPIAINWWDTAEGTWRTATLPEEIVQVAPGLNQTTGVAQPAPATTPLVAPVQAPATVNWITIVLAAIASLLAGVCLWLYGRVRALEADPAAAAKHETPATNLDEKTRWRELNQTLSAQKPADVRRAVVRWANSALPGRSITKLDQINDIAIDPQLSTNLKTLDSLLYRNATAIETSLDYNNLGTQLGELRKSIQSGDIETADREKSALPDLYLAHGNS